MMLSIENYFDYAATTPIAPQVLVAMCESEQKKFGNPSSAHSWGQTAYGTVESVRNSLADLFNVLSENIVFTGSATEANNIVISGTVLNYWKKTQKKAHLLISDTEHSSVSRTAEALAEMGFCSVDWIPPCEFGQIHVEDIDSRICPETILVSIIFANSELGTINPIAKIGALCRTRGIIFHSDATQYAAHFALDFRELALDFMSIGAHKCYGPKGVGAVLCGERYPLYPIIFGGKQESGLRAATQNIAGIVGLGVCYEQIYAEIDSQAKHNCVIRDLIIQEVLKIDGVILTGHAQMRLPNHASFAFQNIDASLLVSLLDQKGFAVSVGSACRTIATNGQKQLNAIGLAQDWVNGGLRISCGKHNTFESARSLCEAITEAVTFLRTFQW